MSNTPTGPTPKPNRRRATAPEREARAADTTELPVDPSPAPTSDLTGDERAELERLRAQVAASQALPQGAAPPPAGPPRTGRGRWAGAIVLLLVAALLAPLSALANCGMAVLSASSSTTPGRRSV